MPVPIFAAAVIAAASPASDAAFPSIAAMQRALNDLEKCPGPSGPDCPPPHRRYKVHGAKCTPIPPENGRRSVTCRVDETLTYADPSQETTRYRDSCVRFAELDGSASEPDWTVVQVGERPCEMPTALKGDPNRTPKRSELERALVGKFRCFELGEMFQCGPRPKGATVETFRCKPLAPAGELEAPVACRVTAEVTFSGCAPVRRLEEECLRLDRITPADQSPAHWVAFHVPDEVRCEIR